VTIRENLEMTIDPVSIFSATHTDVCPITGTLKDEGCGNAYSGTGITMSGSTISMTMNEPGTETVCLEFNNGQDTKTLDVVVHSCTPGITMSNFAHN
jgi:hypothetical protein